MPCFGEIHKAGVYPVLRMLKSSLSLGRRPVTCHVKSKVPGRGRGSEVMKNDQRLT